tara:strand:- start:146 stop:1513 length:1368 start_codon:yes stop_codon:yes gene_type:complete
MEAFNIVGLDSSFERTKILDTGLVALEEVSRCAPYLTLEFRKHEDIPASWGCPAGKNERADLPVKLDTLFQFRIWSTYSGVHYGTVTCFETENIADKNPHASSDPNIAKRLNRSFIFFTHEICKREKLVEVRHDSSGYVDAWNKHTEMATVSFASDPREAEKIIRNKFFKRIWFRLMAQLPPIPNRSQAEEGYGRECDTVTAYTPAVIFDTSDIPPVNWVDSDNETCHNRLLLRLNEESNKTLHDELEPFIELYKDNKFRIPFGGWGLPDISSIGRNSSDENAIVHAMGILAICANPSRLDNYLQQMPDEAKKELRRYLRYIDKHHKWEHFLGLLTNIPPHYVHHDLTSGKIIYCPTDLCAGKVFPCHYFDSVKEFSQAFPDYGEKMYGLIYHLGELTQKTERHTGFIPTLGVAYREVPPIGSEDRYSPFTPEPNYYFGSEKGWELFYLDSEEED